MCKKKKCADTSLYKPSWFRRTYKIILYNVFWTIALFCFFWLQFNLDTLAYELDYFFFYGITVRTPMLVVMVLSFWFMFRQFIKDILLVVNIFKMLKHDDDVVLVGGSKRMYEGCEGTGKTLNTAYESLLLACAKDRSMRLRYYVAYPFRIEKFNDVDFKVLEEHFNFYEDNADIYIPHLMANFNIEYDNRKNYDFDMDYFDQKKRIAESMSLALTEIGNDLPNAWSRIPQDDLKDIHDMKIKTESFSLSRQWWDMHIVADEQRTGEVVLSFRSVVASNYRLEERKKILEPKFLIAISSRLEDLILKRKKKTSKFLSAFYSKLMNLIEDIGFYKFIYKSKEAIQDTVKAENLNFVISCDLPFSFDTRGERKKYKDYEKSPDF